jgi:hypothetical protein
MGQEIKCRVEYQGETHSGRVLLESTEIIVRGDFRLKIPFSSIKKLHAENGVLQVHTREGLALFHLGPKAEKWLDKIKNPKSLVDKLGVKPGDPVTLLGKFDATFLAELKKHKAIIQTSLKRNDPQWIFQNVESRQDLAQIKKTAAVLKGSAALWLVYPKGIKTITEHDVRSAGLAAGLTDIKVASFSPTHTALKFVIPLARR